MKKLSNTEAELKKSVAYDKKHVISHIYYGKKTKIFFHNDNLLSYYLFAY